MPFNTSVDFLFTGIVLIHVRLFQYMKLLLNGKYYISCAEYHASQTAR